MNLLRVTGLLVLVVVVWLGMSGQWRTLSSSLPGVVKGEKTVQVKSAAREPAKKADAPPMPAQPLLNNDTVVTWRDAQGVVHFASAGLAPAGAHPHTPGSPATPPPSSPPPPAARDAR